MHATFHAWHPMRGLSWRYRVARCAGRLMGCMSWWIAGNCSLTGTGSLWIGCWPGGGRSLLPSLRSVQGQVSCCWDGGSQAGPVPRRVYVYSPHVGLPTGPRHSVLLSGQRVTVQSCVCPLVCYVFLHNCALAGLMWRLSRGVSTVWKHPGRHACAANALVMMLPLLCARLFLAKTGSSAMSRTSSTFCWNALHIMISELHALRSQHLLLTGWLGPHRMAMVFTHEAQSSRGEDLRLHWVFIWPSALPPNQGFTRPS
jgi:hypothetical protein